MNRFARVLIVVVAAGFVLYMVRQSKGKTFTVEEYQRADAAKSAALERVLGPMDEMVGHAIVPFQMGGAVDMYYFSSGIPGTGFATMELMESDGSGPRPNRIGTYELVAFTKQRMLASSEKTVGNGFNKIERRICATLTNIGFYSREAVLNPGETVELEEPKCCLILDEYAPNGARFEINGRRHCLLLCLEVFRSEMEYARKNGSEAVLRKLKEAGYYPYSDLDRKPLF